MKHYKWVYDLRGLDSKEAVEAATGLTLPMRVLTDEVCGCVAWRVHAAMAGLLACSVVWRIHAAMAELLTCSKLPG